jgi:hypothetical protein
MTGHDPTGARKRGPLVLGGVFNALVFAEFQVGVTGMPRPLGCFVIRSHCCPG